MKYLFTAILCLFPLGFVLAAEKIDVNTAPLEDLVKIIHIGKARALELISLRPFSSLDDLDRIKGVGEKRIEDIKNQGLAEVNIPRKPAEDGPPPISAPQIIPLSAKTSKPSAPLLAALFTSFSGGVMILILKKKLKLS